MAGYADYAVHADGRSPLAVARQPYRAGLPCHAVRAATPIAFLIFCAIAFSACLSDRSYEVQGRVVGFGDDRSLIVEHGNIPGLMPAMTMPFDVADASVLDTLQTGDAVEFMLHVRGDSTWIDEIRRLPDDALPQHPAGRRDDLSTSATPLLDTGDRVPDARLTTHADTTLHLRQLEGRPLIVTFIYTRCPLPDFCPRMTDNFVRLQNRISEEDLGPVHLLSITFDPAHDTPAVLRDYADRYDADLSTWTFATGDSAAVISLAQRFGVYTRSQGGEIVHNLSTTLVGPDGRVRRIWRGSEWRVEDIVDSVRRMKNG